MSWPSYVSGSSLIPPIVIPLLLIAAVVAAALYGFYGS